MESKSESSSLCKILIGFLGVGVLVFITSAATLFVVQNFYSGKICATPIQRLAKHEIQFPKEKTQWDYSKALHIDEKFVTVKRTSDNQCLITPLHKTNDARVLTVVSDEPLSKQMTEYVAGPDAVAFCEDTEIILLKNVEQDVRQKRQTARKTGLDKEYEQRTPRCMNLILDCGKDGAIGKTQECYTGINGILLLEQSCISATQFKIKMDKPPGRILKIFQQQWKICVERRKEGKAC